MRAFGRLPSPPDERDWPAERLLSMIEEGAAVPVAWNCPVVLDQGSTPHCCGFAAAGFKAAASSTASPDPTINDAEGHRLYERCKQVDGMPTEEGSTIRAVAQVLQQEGTIDHYGWATFDQGQQWIRTYGPVILGINWKQGMMSPVNGVVFAKGDLLGGHAILWRGGEQSPEENLLHNSWGKGWGEDGHCYISDIDLWKLIDSEHGECLVTVRLTSKPWTDWPSGNEEEAARWIKDKGAMRGYPDGSFHPWQNLTYRQVDLIAGRVGLNTPKEWRDRWSECPRSAVRDTFPEFTWNEERWEEPITRFQMLLLLYRWLSTKY